jgi:predicted nucleic acid-binding protein
LAARGIEKPDRIIIASARVLGAALVTHDDRMIDSDRVPTV